MKQLFTAAAALAALLAAVPAVAADQTAKDFVTKAMEGNMAEIELGRLAESQAQSQDVKGFARGMVNDHGKARDQLATIAKKESLTMGTKLSDADQKRMDQLKAMKGSQFDQAYMADMVKDHQDEVQSYQQAQKSITDPEIKAYIDQTLPILQSHLQSAQKLHQPEAAATPGQTKQQQTR